MPNAILLKQTTNDKTDTVIQRTGKAMTVLNLAFFELQTVQRALNEFFALSANAVLDFIFANPNTGKLKEKSEEEQISYLLTCLGDDGTELASM